MHSKHYPLLCYLLIFILLFPNRASNGQTAVNGSLKTVVIDAGHGGRDPGAVSGGVQEKDIVLSIALKLGNKIKAAFPEVRVIYTRDRDIFVPLFERADIANRNKADLFISLHANYVSTPSVRGTETFTLGLHRSQENLEVAKKENAVILLEENYTTNYEGFNPNEAESYIMFEHLQSEYQSQSIELAAYVQESFSNHLRPNNRGVKQAGFLVLRRASMPSVLVEVGFISHPDERRYMASAEGQEQLSESIFKAFSSYKKQIDLRSNFSISGNDRSTPSTARPAAEPAARTQTAQTERPATVGSQQAAVASQLETPAPVQNTPTAATRPTPPATNNTDLQRWYGVQIAALSQVLPPNATQFKGEQGVTRLEQGNIQKYIAGRFATYSEAVGARNRIRSKFSDAFVVVVENGNARLARE